MPPRDAPDELLGSSLHGERYMVSGVLGEGSQGTTLAAVDKLKGRPVAIKRFMVRGARSWKEVELAEREARVLGRLEHPLLPRALDHFEEDGALYLVMEHIHGPTLQSLGTMVAWEVVAFLHDADRVLEYLHGQSPPIIHRDIKPRNVIRRMPEATGGGVRTEHLLVDFGSVRDSLKPEGGSTVVGTFGYMAPEQFQGRAGPASDVFAVGATALRMLTGIEPEKLPHRGLAIDVQAALQGRWPELQRVLLAMLQPNPDERAQAIGPLLVGLPSYRQRASGSEPGGDHRNTADSDSAPQEQAPAAKQKRGPGQAPGPESSAAAVRPQADMVGPPFPRLLGALPLIALHVARLAVSLTTRLIVPLVLTLLSLMLGPALKRAANRVSRAGKRADNTLQRHASALRASLATPPHGPGARGKRKHHRRAKRNRQQRKADGLRFEDAGDGAASTPPAGGKAANTAPSVAEDALEEFEGALEEAADELSEELSRPRRRR